MCALFAFTQGFKSPKYNILLRVTRFSYYNIAIWLSTCETVRAACFMWAACITTIHPAVSQTKWILCSSEIEHISPKARDSCASYTSIIILSRNTVWSCSFLFIWQNEFVDSDCLLQPLHAREFYFKTYSWSKKPAVYDSTDICSYSQAMSFVSCCQCWRASLVDIIGLNLWFLSNLDFVVAMKLCSQISPTLERTVLLKWWPKQQI